MTNNPDPAIPLISEHDTWISIDPFLGCPANCEYCYLQLHTLTSKNPVARATPEEVSSALYECFGKQGPCWGGQALYPMPICIGNYTDQFMTRAGIEFLKAYLSLHAKQYPSHPLCVATKAKLLEKDISDLDRVGHPLLVFLSQSLIQSKEQWADIERGPTSKPQDTLENALLLQKTRNLIPIHFWRPISERTIPDLATAISYIEKLQASGMCCSVAIGLKCSPMLRFHTKQFADLFNNVELPEADEYLPEEVKARVFEAGRLLNYPVYRQTSCAIAYSMKQQELLGTWRPSIRSELCTPCPCPKSQKILCDTAKRQDTLPQEKILQHIADDLSLPRALVSWNGNLQEIVVEAEINQSTHAKWTHLSGFPIRATKISPTLAWKGRLAREGQTLST